MARKLTYRGTRESREPVIVEFEDGRRFELPGDIQSDGFLGFIESYGRFLDGDVMPASVIGPFFRAVLPEAQYGELRKELSISELITLAKDLWPLYFGGGVDDGEDGREDGGKAPLAST
jgi:hypothetical protein